MQLAHRLTTITKITIKLIIRLRIFALIYIVLEMKSRMYCYNYSQKHLKYIQNLPNSKDILKIFPERDCSSDQQASGDHGLNYLGTSGPNKTSEQHHHN